MSLFVTNISEESRFRNLSDFLCYAAGVAPGVIVTVNEL